MSTRRLDAAIAELARDLAEVRQRLAVWVVAPKPTRPSSPAADTAEERRRARLVARLLAELLAYRRHLAGERGPQSTSNAALRAVESGVHGSGCSGTKGSGMAPREDPEPAAPEPPCEAERRYWARAHLPWHWLRKHLVEAPLSLATPCTTLRMETLGDDGEHGGFVVGVEEYVGWRTSSPEQCLKWWAKLEGADSRGAYAGMHDAGMTALTACAEEYFS